MSNEGRSMAAGWQKHRTPAFGDWNYPRDDGAGANDWAAALTPCIHLASATAMRTAARPAAQQKCKKRPPMPTARRTRIPAFGEWNHHHGNDGGNANGIGTGTWAPAVMTPFFDHATTPRKEPQTGRRRGGGAGDGVHAAKLATAAAEPHQGHTQTTRRSKVADSGAYAAAARRSCFAVAKPVDDDLYRVPPDMLYGKPPGARNDGGWRRRILRVLGCSSSCLRPSAAAAS